MMFGRPSHTDDLTMIPGRGKTTHGLLIVTDEQKNEPIPAPSGRGGEGNRPGGEKNEERMRNRSSSYVLRFN